jgi:anti-sigma28 factor (negative regulator of flagellin synthesis)
MMIIQNLQNTFQVEIKRTIKPDLKRQKDDAEKLVTSQDSAASVSELIPEERQALLASIKSKIKKGFYNSDSVLEDLSHSFASALDQTI